MSPGGEAAALTPIPAASPEATLRPHGSLTRLQPPALGSGALISHCCSALGCVAAWQCSTGQALVRMLSCAWCRVNHLHPLQLPRRRHPDAHHGAHHRRQQAEVLLLQLRCACITSLTRDLFVGMLRVSGTSLQLLLMASLDVDM